MDHRLWRVGQRSHAWPAVQGAISAHIAANFSRRNKMIRGIGPVYAKKSLCARLAKTCSMSLRQHPNHLRDARAPWSAERKTRFPRCDRSPARRGPLKLPELKTAAAHPSLGLLGWVWLAPVKPPHRISMLHI